MLRHTFLTLLLVLASGSLSLSQTSPTTTTTTTTTTPAAPTTTTPAAPTTTTAAPTTAKTTTTTAAPTTAAPTTAAPTTAAPTTAAPTTAAGNATTVAPTTPPTTTVAPTTPANTTVVPTTHPTAPNTTIPANTTVPAPTTPTPPMPNPETGNYTLQTGNSSCLMARMGLQVSYKQGSQPVQSVNLDPKKAKVTGGCGKEGNSSTLELETDEVTMTFTFANASNKFHLSAFNVIVKTPSGEFKDGNDTLSLWLASLGSSYMCRKEQDDMISNAVTLHTFDLQVQPFAVEEDKFSTAHECAMDDTSILIPIIVGAALAGLILIVVIAYLIGRRKTYVGYQTL
ncbi:lysosome-associated membrane glycoprotein 2 isoform X2 [Engraulis encrasicolus]|uniref:lysosome-associated membrane glycoprotein 2 isoform X2 n=1 Tax=Engraulis encrasicolus TaxID=184585 RepID=UPI002FCFD681